MKPDDPEILCPPEVPDSKSTRITVTRFATIAIVAATLALPHAAMQAAEPAEPWGAPAGGLQLLIRTGPNTEALTETRSMLFLDTSIRNVSNASILVDLDQATFDFEYEIDGIWYAFAPQEPVRKAGDPRDDPAYRELTQAVAPGALKQTFLTVPLAGRSPAMVLRAITANGPGRQFDPARGPHVVRVRPGRTLDANRPTPVSNAVTISFGTPRSAATGQSVVFTPARDTPLRELRFAGGPANAQAIIRQVLARPPQPSSVPGVITAATLQVIDPLPYYRLLIPRRVGAPDPVLPAAPEQYHYLVSSGQRAEATIALVSHQGTTTFHWMGVVANSDPAFRGLQRLAAMEQVRGGNYEPRLLSITPFRGLSTMLVLWLHSSSGKPDLFYRPNDPEFHGWTKVASDRLYTRDELLQAARALPVAPRRDASWAIRATMECARNRSPEYGGTLSPEQAVVEIDVNSRQDGILWYVFIPERLPGNQRALVKPEPGAAMQVDEADGSCKPVARE